jgi:hypothetical protein
MHLTGTQTGATLSLGRDEIFITMRQGGDFLSARWQGPNRQHHSPGLHAPTRPLRLFPEKYVDLFEDIDMATKKYSIDEIFEKLGKIDVLISLGRSVSDALHLIGVSARKH